MTTTTTSMAIIAIVAALALLVVIVLAVMTIPTQEAEAGCERGPAVNRSFERSNGRCFNPR